MVFAPNSITITQRYVHPQAQAITTAFEKMNDRQKVVIAGGHSDQSTREKPDNEVVVNAG